MLGPFFYKFQKIKEKKKIKAKILVSESVKNTEIMKKMVGKHKFPGEFRFLPKEFEGPTSTVIYGNKIAIIAWHDLIAFVLESRETNRVYKKYFDALWKIAKKF